MNRRDFVQATAAVAAIAATGVRGASARRRPNLLYVFSDQHRAASLPGEPFNQAAAPNLDAFRHANFSMDRCVSNYPLCTPYRGILMSGRWPYQTGLTHNNVALPSNEISLGRVFRDAGYHTGYVGKWHLQGRGNAFIPAGPDRMGFEDWHVWARTNAHYRSWTYDPDTGARVQPDGWNCTTMTDQAITLIEQQQGATKPWMLMVSWNPPHPPYNPPAQDAERYPPGQLKLRPNVSFPLQGKSAAGEARPLTGAEPLRAAMQGYNGAITGVDAEFGRLLATLEASGQAEDTIVVYTSDHGDMMGSQGRMAKQVPFEESCRVPFFIRYPGVTPKGGTSDTLFAAIDIYPTLCALAGLPVPRHCAGRDMSAVMRGGSVEASQAVFLMNQLPHAVDGLQANGEDGDAGETASDGPVRQGRETRPGHQFINQPTYRGLRTDIHTYAVAETGRWCLYDNVADPFQMKNLVRDPAHLAMMTGFDKQIGAWLISAGDPFPLADAVTRITDFPT
jgi:arylsulfatase A-like enzyme